MEAWPKKVEITEDMANDLGIILERLKKTCDPYYDAEIKTLNNILEGEKWGNQKKK